MPKINQIVENISIDENGEVKHQTKNTTYRLPDEPPYIKLYLDTLLYLADLPKAYNPVLAAILKRMPWANANQGIAINAGLKRLIAKELGISVSRISNAITDLVKGELLYRLDVGLYAVNPHLFGKGEWADIERLRLEVTFDANGRTVKGEIEKKTKHREPELKGQTKLEIV